METAGQRSSMSREAMKHIKTWSERCEKHPDHQTGMITERMIQERMQEEIDELRQALKKEWVGLTEKEWHEATGIPRNATLPIPMLKGIEKALKKKNHGQP